MNPPTRRSIWFDRLANVALATVVGLLLYRWVLPRASDPVGDLGRQPVFPPGHARLLELSATY